MMYYNFFSYSYSTVKWSVKISRYVYSKVKKNPEIKESVLKETTQGLSPSDVTFSEDEWITVEKTE